MTQASSQQNSVQAGDFDFSETINSVSAWRNLLNEKGLDSTLNRLSSLPMWKKDVAVLAMEAAFEEKSKEMATAIDQRWRPHLNLTQLSNKADWLHREVLFFLRGGNEFWLKILLLNNGHAQKDAFSSCFQEIEHQIRSRADIEVERVSRFIDLAFEFGASPLHRGDDSDVSALVKATELLPLIAEHYPDQENSWKSVIDKIEGLNTQVMAFDQHEADLRSALDDLTVQNIGMLGPVIKRALEIPKAHRRLSPFEIIFDKCEEDSYMENIERSGVQYPITQAFKALLDFGFDVNAHQPHGKTAVHSLVKSNGLEVSIIDECMQIALSYGADLDLTEIVSLGFPWSNGTHVLHEAVYLGSPPIRIMKNQCVSIDPQDDLGNTPSMYAARERKYDLVNDMLNMGADPKIENEDGSTLAHEICIHALYEFTDVPFDMGNMLIAMESIKNSGFDFASTNREGKSCFEMLMMAASSDDRAAVCLQILQSFDDRGWSMPYEKMQRSIPPQSQPQSLNRFLNQKISELEAKSIGRYTARVSRTSKRRL